MTSISYDLDKIRIYLENIDTKLEEVKLSYVDFGLEGNSAGLNSFVYSYARLSNFLVEYRSFVKNDILDVCNTVKAYVEKDNSIAKHLSGNEEGFLNFTANINNAYISDNSQTIPIDTVDLQTGLSSFRISRLDTENTASKLTEELLSLSARLIELKGLIDAFSKDTSALTGQYAEAMQKYWAEVHIPIIKEIDTALWTLNTHMTNYSSELYQLVSDDSYFVLTQSEMEAAITELTNIQASLAIIVDDVDSKITSYSSLLGINVTIPNGRPMLSKFQQMANRIQSLIENIEGFESSKVSIIKGYIDDYVTNMIKIMINVDERIIDITKYSNGLFKTICEAQELKLVADAEACKKDEEKLIDAFEAANPEYADAMNKFLDNDADPLADLSDDMKKAIKYTAYTAPEPYRTVIMNEIMNGKVTIGWLNTQFLHWKDIELRSHNLPGTGVVDFSKYDRDSIETFWHEMGHASDNQGAPYGTWGSVESQYAFKTYCPALGREVSFKEAMYYDIYENPDNPHSIYSLAKSCGVPGNYDNVAKAFWENSYDKLSDEDKKLYEEVCKRFQNDITKSPEYSAVADSYGGMTHNGIVKTYDAQTHTETGYARNGGGIHEDWYWIKPEVIAPTEFYAEYFSAKVSGNAEKVALMKQYYPEACKIADKYTEFLAGE